MTRKALVENDGSAAFEATERTSRSALDAEELHELEHSLYYQVLEPASTPAEPLGPGPVPTPRRSLIARLFRRG